MKKHKRIHPTCMWAWYMNDLREKQLASVDRKIDRDLDTEVGEYFKAVMNCYALSNRQLSEG